MDSIDELADRIAELAAHLDSGVQRLLVCIREFDEAGGWERQGAVSCAHWLSWRIGIDLVTAREKVRVARALGSLSRIDQALARGELSYAKIRALTRVASPANEERLLELARSATGAQLDRICRVYRQAVRSGGEEGVVPEERSVRERLLPGGMVKIELVLSPDEAALVLKALEKARDSLAKEERLVASAARAAPATAGTAVNGSVVVHDKEPRLAAPAAGASADEGSAVGGSVGIDGAGVDDFSGSSVPFASEEEFGDVGQAAEEAPGASVASAPGEAFGALVASTSREAPGASVASASGETPGDVAHAPAEASGDFAHASGKQRGVSLADAVVAIAEGVLAQGGDAGTGSGGDRYQVMVHLDQDVLAGEDRWAATLDDGTRLDPEGLRRLACDAGLVATRTDAAGVTLDVGRRTRAIPPALRRALWVRDRGCRWPGCTHTRFLHGHHIHHWMHGGPTCLDNVLLLCSRHHRLVHEGGFGVENVEGRLTFVMPTGQRMSALPPVHEEQVAEDVIAALKAWARERDIEIGPDTNLPWWDGAAPDYDLAISSLMTVG